jgi:putative membrane protein (TIGR04086 family)
VRVAQSFLINMLKSVTGVVVGYLLFAVSAALLFLASGRDPHQEQGIGFVVFSVVYGMVFAAAGGYAAGAIAGRKPRLHGGAVALVLALGATVSFLAQPGAGSRWSQITALVLMAPAALVGGIARSKHKGSTL